MNWHKWIGKPHRTGDDPAIDDGCDCLLMVVRIREHLGLPVPKINETKALIDLAKAGAYSEIHSLIKKHLEPVQKPCDGAFMIFETPDQIGTAVIIEGGLLHVSHKKGVRWFPSNMVRQFNWFHWK